MTIYVPLPPSVGSPQPIEVVVQRRLTEAFIATQPVVVTLVPHNTAPTSSGGTRSTPLAPRTPQTMRLIEPASPEAVRNAQTGSERRTMYELLGLWDAVMDVGDTFVIPGDSAAWRIAQLFFFNGYERRAEVIRIGK